MVINGYAVNAQSVQDVPADTSTITSRWDSCAFGNDCGHKATFIVVIRLLKGTGYDFHKISYANACRRLACMSIDHPSLVNFAPPCFDQSTNTPKSNQTEPSPTW